MQHGSSKVNADNVCRLESP